MCSASITGCEIVATGADKRWEEDGGRRAEFLRTAKRLEWTLLKHAPHEVSIFDDLSAEPPAYIKRRNTASEPDFNGWFSGRAVRQELQAALDARRPQ